ncbi:L-erythro-3,5-diaminohexanoate dehydrogenase [Nocardioides dubius]|uniref:L-erythro-3,5-diaminohexanoate dehydrogenase n=1 Tax=Nocardioides dubius TaxID=317019 RepID=A0ABN1TMD0_9ACTN
MVDGGLRVHEKAADPIGTHRVRDGEQVVPQSARRLATDPQLWPDEARIRVSRLNLDAASYRQLSERHRGPTGVDGAALRAEVAAIIAERGKMQNPVTGSGGMLLGTVEEVGPEHTSGIAVGDRVATLVSLTLTPLVIEDGLSAWDGLSEQVPTDGYAILFGRTIVATVPADLPEELSLAVLDVCGAPALTRRTVAAARAESVVVIGAAGKSGSLSLAAARDAGARLLIGVVPTQAEHDQLAATGLADAIVVADARDPIALRDAVAGAGGPGQVTVVCVDVAGCEAGAVLATADGGTVIFFSMATSFASAALSAEGLVADVTMLVGNGYLPGHAGYALDLVRRQPAVRAHLERRL